MRILFLLIISLLLHQQQSFAQKEEKKNQYMIWADVGAGGIRSEGSRTGIATFLGVSLQKNESLLMQIRFTNADTGINYVIPRTNKFNELGFLIGKSICSKYVQLKGTTGLAYISGTKNASGDPYEEDLKSFQSFGVPYEFGLMLTPSNNWGIEIGYMGNINNQRTTTGIYLKAVMGNISTRKIR